MSFRLRSRALTARCAIRLRSAALSFAFRAAAAFLAIAERSALDKLLARAFPPNLPKATAFGFFVRDIVRLSSLALSESREKGLFSMVVPPFGQLWAAPLEADVTA